MRSRSQLLGYVGPNASNNGQSGHYGIEGFYDSTLGGGADAAGADITLTIDPNVQIEAEKILDNLITAQGATGGSVIVKDPQTGKILAMGSTPNFDPNNYSASSLAREFFESRRPEGLRAGIGLQSAHDGGGH